MLALELRIPPLALVVAFGVAMATIAAWVPAAISIPWRLPASGALMIVGALIAVAGVVAFRLHKTTVNPLTPDQSSSLVRSGIYRVSRNPMYLGFLVALVGWGVFLANWVAALPLPLFVAYLNHFQIHPEERALTQRFGEEFLSYSQSVRRWL